ncbi:flavin-containing monooxygenase [Gordonia neofelifaecis]|uniref:Fad-dependent monooxygenase n=1 Tax=Gordonia neofelifaecis NRRL B-59395 TaxID=644548 RepID=F1YN63_9ACTN|nr:NAD(P)/FAD-dependent oxidoreductase [Gordonia neofelifaecis]EGD53868.1 fad-dependent monooxygenase [Gordonia neofelifaecis NRRL B-59395]
MAFDTVPGAAPAAEALRTHLQSADPAVLLAVLAQLTGSADPLDRYGDAVTHVPAAPEMAGVTDATTAAAIIDDLLDALDAADDLPTECDTALFARLAPLALGVPVGEEFLPMLSEQGGFHRARPVVSRAEPLPETLSLAIIGGGLAGIAAAIAATHEGLDYELFERGDRLGGTWATQTYPGVGVDTPSSYYSLSSELNPDWSSYYPKGGEYHDYLLALGRKYAIGDHTRFGTEVTSLTWDDDAALWTVGFVDHNGNTGTARATVVMTALGYLNRAKFPDVPGRDDFAGLSIHSGDWDPSIDLAGKRVAVIGAGCTAAQLVDSLAPEVAHLTQFQRQPHWVAPRKRESDDVPDYQRILCRELPYYANWLRLKAFWGSADSAYPVVIVDPDWAASHLSISPANDFLLRDCLAYIDRTFGAGSALADAVTPDFAPFGKRIIRDPGGYYPALTRDHVDLVAGEPAEVVPEGIVTADGTLVELDAIVYATGYHLDFLSTLDIHGRDGRTLNDEWSGNPRAYRGGTVPGFPNLFITSAPNANPSHGAGNNFGIEVAVHYLIECLHLMKVHGARSIEVTPQAYDDYVAQIDRSMEDTVWRHTPTAHTYYRNETGRVVVACPWRLVDVWHQHRTPDVAHFILR